MSTLHAFTTTNITDANQVTSSYKNIPLIFPQKLRSFHSLSCPGIPAEDHSESNPAVFNLRSSVHFENGHSNEHRTDDAESGTKDLRGNPPLCPTIEDVDWTPSDCGETTPVMTNGKDGEALWAGRCSMRRDVYQLGGELDIEQIERN